MKRIISIQKEPKKMLKVANEIQDYIVANLPELRGVYLESDEVKMNVPGVIIIHAGTQAQNRSGSELVSFSQHWHIDLTLPRYRIREQAGELLASLVALLHRWKPESAIADLMVDGIDGPLIESQYTNYRLKFSTAISVSLQ